MFGAGHIPAASAALDEKILCNLSTLMMSYPHLIPSKTE